MTALLGTFVTMKTMADGTCRITLDLQCKLADFAALGADPGTPFGIARITQEAAAAEAQQKAIASEEKSLGPLAKWAVMRCKEPEFQEFVRGQLVGAWGVASEESAKQFICELCDIESRRELDTNPMAARDFREQIMQPWSVSHLNPHREAA